MGTLQGCSNSVCARYSTALARGKSSAVNLDVELPPQIANLPGVSRIDGNPLEVLKRKAESIDAFKPRVITPEVEIESEQIVPQFLIDLVAKIPRDASTWRMIGAVILGIVVTGYAIKVIYRALKYRWQATHIERAIKLLNEAHAEDPFKRPDKSPRELYFTEKAVKWLARLNPKASPELELAVRAHKLESWKPRRVQRRVGEFLKLAGLRYLIAPVNFILERRGDAEDSNRIAFQNAVALTNLEGLLESQMEGPGLQEDAFLALFSKEYQELRNEGWKLGWELVNGLPEPLRGKVWAEVQAITTKREKDSRSAPAP